MLSPTRLRRFQALGIDPARDQDMADKYQIIQESERVGDPIAEIQLNTSTFAGAKSV